MHCIELSKVQLELQQAIAAINSYHHHLGELVSLRHQNRDLLSSQPETSQRIDLVIGRALAVIQRSGMWLSSCLVLVLACTITVGDLSISAGFFPALVIRPFLGSSRGRR